MSDTDHDEEEGDPKNTGILSESSCRVMGARSSALKAAQVKEVSVMETA
jgi:hypothetical protein